MEKREDNKNYKQSLYINETKQTVKFNLEDTMFFCQDAKRNLRQLPRNVLDEEIFRQMEQL